MSGGHSHSFHLVEPSPWPALGAMAAFVTAVGAIMFMHDKPLGVPIKSTGLVFILITMFFWWRDVIREAEHQGHHTPIVQIGMRYGMILFIASEVRFFLAFFWAFFDSSLYPDTGIWPPAGVETFDAFDIPLINTMVFTIIFGNLAKISTDGVPPFIFYMSGTVAWSYFASCITLTSNTFSQNSDIFGKVYFPRITVPIANVIISLLQFFIQFTIFILFLIYFALKGGLIHPNIYILLLPLIILQMAVLGLGFGILISSLTTKYKDLTFVMSFFVQLWMYATPIVYPLSIVPEKYRLLVILNPMASIVETFRGAFLGVSSIELSHIFISVSFTLLIFFLGLLMFNRVEKSFMDTI